MSIVTTSVTALIYASEQSRVIRECNQATDNFIRGEVSLHVCGYGWVVAKSLTDVTSTLEHAVIYA